MRADQLLRRYLEQRREMGETELILDRLTVEEVMRLIRGAPRAAIAPSAAEQAFAAAPDFAAPPPERQKPQVADSEAVPSTGHFEWREAILAAERSASERHAAEPQHSQSDDAVFSPATKVKPAGRSVGGTIARISALGPQGKVVGSGETELFGGPLSEATTLDALHELVRTCTRCPLSLTATNPVPGDGSPRAQLFCVGEAPGANEDATGHAFVGVAGQLLTKILAAINLSREEVFIANVLKHRPPQNRSPRPEEVEACSPYLVRQLDLIRPKVIIAFGTFAAQTLLVTKDGIGKLRGAIHWYHGIPLIVTYHPAALLRNPAWKRPAWDDVKLARRILDSV